MRKRRLTGYYTEAKNLNIARRTRTDAQIEFSKAVSSGRVVGGYCTTPTTLEEVLDLVPKEAYSE